MFAHVFSGLGELIQTEPAPFFWWGSSSDDFRRANLFFPGLKPESGVNVSFGNKR